MAVGVSILQLHPKLPVLFDLILGFVPEYSNVQPPPTFTLYFPELGDLIPNLSPRIGICICAFHSCLRKGYY